MTGEQVNSFLNQWEKDATIGSLTLFFEQNTGDLVLNKDNENYNTYLEIAEAYLGLSANGRAEAKACCPVGFEKTMTVLENCLKYRRIEQEIFRARANCIDSNPSRVVLNGIINRYSNVAAAVYIAFRYGVMQGKRMERAKKRKDK